MKKLSLALAPLLALLAFAVAPSAALARPCRVLVAWTAVPAVGKCAEPPGVSTEEAQNLRNEADGSETTPPSVGFPTEVLAANTRTALGWSMKVSGVSFTDEAPAGYVFLALKLNGNPESSTTTCRAATGSIPWVNIGDFAPGEVFDGSGAWTFTIDSNSKACTEKSEAGKVTIRGVSLLFNKNGVFTTQVVAGTLVGQYAQPSTEGPCPAGGIELNREQPGLTSEPKPEKIEISGDLCFVSSNDYLYPATAPKWEKFTNSTGKEKAGLWNTKEP